MQHRGRTGILRWLLCLVLALGLMTALSTTAWADGEHTVTVNSSAHGTMNPDKATAASGTDITLTATPDDGYILGDITVSIVPETVGDLVAALGDRELTLSRDDGFSITLNSSTYSGLDYDPEDYSDYKGDRSALLTYSGNGVYSAPLTNTITPHNVYNFDFTVSDDGKITKIAWGTYAIDTEANNYRLKAVDLTEVAGNENEYTFTMPDRGVVVTAEFEVPHTHTNPVDETTVIFRRWKSKTSLPDKPGNYYLMNDVELSGTWDVPKGTVNLCLGQLKKITGNLGEMIKVGQGATLNLYSEVNSERVAGKIYSNYNNHASTITVDGGTLNLSDVTIGNPVTNDAKAGGGVKLNSGEFTMYSGKVTQSTPGVEVNNGTTFTMNGGEVTYNKTGVKVKSGGTFTINGGTVDDSTEGYGVDVESGGTFNMNGGLFYNGLNQNRQGVVVESGATFKVSGNPRFTVSESLSNMSHVYLKNGATLAVATEGMSNIVPIYIAMETPGVFTTGTAGAYASHFTGDSDAYFVQENEGGELELYKPVYSISVKEGIQNGTVTATPTSAQAGDAVTGMATPTDSTNVLEELIAQTGDPKTVGDVIAAMENRAFAGGAAGYAKALGANLYILTSLEEEGQTASINADTELTASEETEGVYTATDADGKTWTFTASNGKLSGITVSDVGSFSGASKGTLFKKDNVTVDEQNAYSFNIAGNVTMDAVFTPPHTHVLGTDTTTFKPWAETASMPTAAGNYYLVHDVTLADMWTVPNGTINLCLNGKSITCSGGNVIRVSGNSCVLNLYDDEGNGSIKGSSSSGVIVNSSGSSFNLYSGTITGNGASGVAVGTNGIFNMYGGSITGNSTANNGGGVLVSGSGSFTMRGGSITDNRSSSYGGGVYVEAGGTFKLSGNAVISGNTRGTEAAADNVCVVEQPSSNKNSRITIAGELTNETPIGVNKLLIQGNNIESITGTFTSGWSTHMASATDLVKYFTSDLEGGYGMYVIDNELAVTLEPHNHEADAPGGAKTFEAWDKTESLPVLSGKYYLYKDVTLASTWVIPAGTNIELCLNGKSITYSGESVITLNGTLTLFDDVANAGKITGGTKYGVNIDGTGSFTMYGGSITGNGNTTDGVGVNIGTSGQFTMNGGSITGNLGANGGGVYDGGGFTISGNVNISGNTGGNVYLPDSKTINVNGALTNESPISITMATAGTFTTGWNTHMASATDLDRFFTSDDADYSVTRDGDELKLAPHVHDFYYSADGDTITAVCLTGGCALPNKSATLTVEAPTRTAYYGEGSADASFSASSSGLATPTVLYKKGNDTVATPSDVGSYTAVIALEGVKIDAAGTTGDVSASVSFSISAATMTDVSVAQDGTLTYTGAAQTPAVVATATTLNEQPVTFTYSKTETGTYSATVPSITNVRDAGTFYFKATAPNHEDYSGSFTVTMIGTDPATPTNLRAKYGQTLANVTLPAGWAWQDSTASVGNVGTNTSLADYTASEGSNYSDKSGVSVSITVEKADSSVTAAPTVIAPIFNQQAQALVTAGTASGGAMQYALGTNAKTAPTSGWSANIPTGTNIGEYFVWYKVVGDGNHNDTTPVCIMARIAPQSYTLSFDANGGYSEPKSQSQFKGENVTITNDKPSREDEPGEITVTLDANGGTLKGSDKATGERTYHYTFKNWNTKADGTGTSYAPGAAFTTQEDAVTLYAQWNSSYTGGTVTLPTPTREGYVFLGWGPNKTAKTVYNGSYTPGYRILYAIWEQAAFGTPDYVLPAALTEIGEEAFAGAAVKIMYVPDTCTAIGANAFQNCAGLTQIRLPKNCTIDAAAFTGCSVTVFAPAGGTTESWCASHSIPFIAE